MGFPELLQLIFELGALWALPAEQFQQALVPLFRREVLADGRQVKNNREDPFLSQPDTYRLTFVEKYTGSAAYNRPYHSYSPATADFASNFWREPVPFDLTSDFGQAIAFSATAAWITTPSGVWTASLTAPLLDVTADVVEAAMDDRPFGGRCRIVLRNDGGRYATLPPQIKAGIQSAREWANPKPSVTKAKETHENVPMAIVVNRSLIR